VLASAIVRRSVPVMSTVIFVIRIGKDRFEINTFRRNPICIRDIDNWVLLIES